MSFCVDCVALMHLHLHLADGFIGLSSSGNLAHDFGVTSSMDRNTISILFVKPFLCHLLCWCVMNEAYSNVSNLKWICLQLLRRDPALEEFSSEKS